MDSIQTYEKRSCMNCHTNGEELHRMVHDYRFNGTMDWNFWQCRACGLVWLNPQPQEEYIPLLYPTSYYTHAPSSAQQKSFKVNLLEEIMRAAGGYHASRSVSPLIYSAAKILSRIPFIKEGAFRRVMFVSGPPNGTHLDVGCGSGWLLLATKKLGWDTIGIEPDINAAASLKEHGIPVIPSSLENAGIANNSIAVITARHVIEHLADPIRFIAESGFVD